MARSGTAKTTLYAHFPSKDDLIASYLQRRSEEWRRHLREELARRGGTAAERIDAVFAVLGEGCATPVFAAARSSMPPPSTRTRPTPGAWWRTRTGNGCAICWPVWPRKRASAEPDALAGRLILLYDAAMVGAQFDPGGLAPTSAREAARTLVEAASISAPSGFATRS